MLNRNNFQKSGRFITFYLWNFDELVTETEFAWNQMNNTAHLFDEITRK